MILMGPYQIEIFYNYHLNRAGASFLQAFTKLQARQNLEFSETGIHGSDPLKYKLKFQKKAQENTVSLNQ